MKKTIFTLILLAVVTLMSAQTLQFEYEGHVYENGETIICQYDEALFEYVQHLHIRNTSNQDLNVVVEREILETVDNAMTFFCWGQCLSPDNNISPAVLISANTLSPEDFDIHVSIPEGETRVVKARYYAYDASDPDTKISFLLLAGQTASVSESNLSLGQAYPNPATSQVHFDLRCSDNVNVVVYNLLGQEVKSQLVSGHQNRVNIAVNDLQPGIYFCRFSVNGEVLKTEKFIVKR